MLEQNKATVRRFYETTGDGDLSIIDELLSEDVVIHGSVAAEIVDHPSAGQKLITI